MKTKLLIREVDTNLEDVDIHRNFETGKITGLILPIKAELVSVGDFSDYLTDSEGIDVHKIHSHILNGKLSIQGSSDKGLGKRDIKLLKDKELNKRKLIDLKTPLEEFYYYHRPPYNRYEQKEFRKSLIKAINYIIGN